MPILERINRVGRTSREHYYSQVMFHDFALYGITIESFNPFQVLQSRMTMEKFRLRLGRIQREVEARDDIPEAMKIRLLCHLENMAHFIAESAAR